MILEALVAFGLVNSGTPPVQYQGNSVSVVVTVDNPNTKEACGEGSKGVTILACTFTDKKTGVSTVVMPNPCKYDDVDFYAHLLCHELGHVNGWNRTHDN